MIKTEEIPTTEIIHKIYCDDCGKCIATSEEYDDGYFYNPAEFSCKILSYTYEKELCDECKEKFYTKLKNALLQIGFKGGDKK